jgi:hypothetical protein
MNIYGQRLLRVVFLGSAVFAFLTTTPVWAAQKSLQGHVPQIISRLKSIGRLPATNEMRLAIGASLRDPAGSPSALI